LVQPNSALVSGGAFEPLGPASPYAPAAGPPPMTVGIVRALKHRWKLALCVGLVLATIGAAAMWFLRPAKYTAIVLLRVLPAEPSLLTDRQRGDRAGTIEATMFQKDQLALIKSRPVIDTALQDPKVADLSMLQDRDPDDRASWLEDEIKAAYIEGTDILRMTLSGLKPDELAKLANAVTDAYIKEVVDKERVKKRGIFDQLALIHRDRQEKVRFLKQDQVELAKQLETNDSQVLSHFQRAQLDEYFHMRGELGKLDAEMRIAQLKLEAHQHVSRTGDKLLVPEHLVEQQIETDQAVVAQRRKMYDVEEMIGKDEQRRAQGHNAKLQHDLEQAKERLEMLRGQIRADATQRVHHRLIGEAKQAAQQLHQQISVLARQRSDVEKAVNNLYQRVKSFGERSIQLEVKKADIEEAERMLKRLAQEKDELEVELRADNKRVVPIHGATPPRVKDVKTQILGSVLVGLTGLLLGLFGVSYWEFQAGKVNTADQVSKDMGLKVVGSLPPLSTRPVARRTAANAYLDKSRLNALIESIDGIRTMLLCGDSAGPIHTLMITSANSREGKTMLASHLASSVARTGRKTLLIDGDLRNPSLHKLFNLPADGPGLSEVLRGEIDVSAAVRPAPVPGLVILAAGRSDRQAIQALAREEIRQLFERLRGEYDFIVVDSCPVLPVADSLLVSQHVDAVVMSVRPSVSQAASVLAAHERLQALGVRMLGTVVNGDPRYLHDYNYDSSPQT
jgi:capsular exopolysaccharide synthesis family protein